MALTYTAEEFDRKIKYYFRDCEESRMVFPDEAGMLNFLDIGDDEYEELKQHEEFGKTLLWARRRRTSWLERHMVTNPRSAAGCMNALKQEKNGGYADRAGTGRKESKLIVQLEGFSGFKNVNKPAEPPKKEAAKCSKKK